MLVSISGIKLIKANINRFLLKVTLITLDQCFCILDNQPPENKKLTINLMESSPDFKDEDKIQFNGHSDIETPPDISCK